MLISRVFLQLVLKEQGNQQPGYVNGDVVVEVQLPLCLLMLWLVDGLLTLLSFALVWFSAGDEKTQDFLPPAQRQGS